MNTSSKLSPIKAWRDLKDNWKADLQAGFAVSLIALPLCLGIAIASGFPPMSGLIAAIVGGLLVSRINGSNVTITGPAAGLIVVNLAAVESLGMGDQVAGYHYALAAIFVAGIIIMIFGALKAGKLGDFFPSAAVHGMLAAIGVIIIVKQLFVGIGVKPQGKELLDMMGEIPSALMNMNPEIAAIAIIGLAILIIHPKIRIKWVQAIPAPIWVMAAAIPMAHGFDLFHEHHLHFVGKDFVLGPKNLVKLPDNIKDGIIFPDFGKIGTSAFWIATATIALVTSIESMLSATAVDALDPMKRKSNLNQDLIGMGAGASASGMLGGLPMISEIVRSSANVNNGAKTQWSNFFHGGLLLILLLVGKPIIEQIPMAALSAMLMFTGYRLASPKEFKHVYEIGKEQLIVFVVTLFCVLAIDLLVGIAIGVATELIINLFLGLSPKRTFKASIEAVTDGGKATIRIKESITFSNYLSLKRAIMQHKDKEEIILDKAMTDFIDHSVMDKLHGMERDFISMGKKFSIINHEHLTPVSSHRLSARKRKR